VIRRLPVLAPLAEPRFRLLFAGQVVSNLGDWMDYVALLTLVAYTWRLGPGALSAVAVAVALPMLAAGPVLGAWADRLPARTLMVGCDLARAAVVLGLVVAPGLPVLLGLVVARSTLSALFLPAQQVSIRHVVSERNLLAASSLAQLSLQGAKVAGPALGGILLVAVGVRPLFAIDAATFLVSAVAIARMGALPRAARSAGTGRLRRELVSGLRFVAGSGPLLVAVVGVAVTAFAVFAFDTLLALALRRLGLSSAEFGMAVGLIGVGAFGGSLAIGQWGAGVEPFLLLASSKVVAGAVLVVLGLGAVAGLHPGPAGWVPAMIAIGGASAGILVAYPYILQRETPPELIGRVSSTAAAVLSAAQLAAAPIGAAVATALGVGVVIAAAGAGVTGMGAGVLILRRTRLLGARAVEGAHGGAGVLFGVGRTVQRRQ
jgi:MFS family permease